MNLSSREGCLRFCLIGLFCVFHVFAKAAVQDTSCALLISPAQGETNVSVIAPISFEPVAGAVNYFIDLGTTTGGADILNNFSVGISASFNPPQGMPESTIIYITIRAFFVSGSQSCNSQSFTTQDVTVVPSCTQISFPVNGAVDVPLNTTISWPYAPRATGYIINIGTSPGGIDVVNAQNLGNTLTYNNAVNFNPDTTYYVTVIAYNENGQAVNCVETSFTTEIVATEVPECTQLIAPINGATEVALTPILEWPAVTNVEGYLIRIGTTPGGSDVLANTDIGLATSTAVLDFLEGTLYFVTITPFNAAGEAQNCTQTSFTTTYGCGPYTDGITGEMVDLNPIIDLAENYEICRDNAPLVLSYLEPYERIVWNTINDGEMVSISSDALVTINTSGVYMVEVSTETVIDSGTIICTATHSFEVSIIDPPIIDNLVISNQGNTVNVLVELEEEGDFEYSSTTENGPYQSSALLIDVDATDIQVYVRDRNGCGMDSRRIKPDPGFPKYFTPNGDGVNDTWQVRGVVVNGETVTSIEIYDRFGKRLKTISPYGQGWDGSYQGKALFDNSFWYKANTRSNVTFTGYFALRRY
ncbi:gliding motility-associated-like protein [Dokdonia sp. Hel_I_63]|uniref:T9SS type B sorting domain-containing protein n=1 Tax=Dokdonia sp. Hel_I_63 TaxID=1249996 RepID=UPI00119B96F0|nr:T9SS type B sorting domain-containing protein [Dokdonia sp. Hel_I_63]TVZ23234.1 gliding motility-associated-like protein [Dokdonia sp. Hel_I_63]